MDINLWAVEITILGMAMVTFMTRVSGYWLISKFTLSGRVKVALEVMPGAVLLSIVAPIALTSGIAEAIATVVTMVLALRAPLLVAITGGVLSVVLLRFAIS